MPHDKNGQVLNEGDLVSVSARVKSISTGEEYCNVMLETVEPMYPGDSSIVLSLNAKQVELVERPSPADAVAQAVAAGGE
jgi:hypothetical protein